MKKFIRRLLFLLFPFLLPSVEFDSNAHFQVGTDYPLESSFMKFTGNFHDFFDDSKHMWVLSPKIYLDASNPLSFGLSAGTKHPISSLYIGQHAFCHNHNFGDFPVTQFGHTLELLHPSWEARVNYYYPAFAVREYMGRVLSSQKVEAEAAFNLKKGKISFKPIYNISDNRWGGSSKLTFVFEKIDIGIEVMKPPSEAARQDYPVQTALFTVFKFPVKKFSSCYPEGDRSIHYSPLVIEGPKSYGRAKPIQDE